MVTTYGTGWPTMYSVSGGVTTICLSGRNVTGTIVAAESSTKRFTLVVKVRLK